MIENAALTPMPIFFGAPLVCRYAFETAGRAWKASNWNTCSQPILTYLSEMMNYPGVLNNARTSSPKSN